MEYGLIGEKLSHSFSKTVHGYLASYDYELKEIKKENLESFMIAKEFEAINVTIPYKEMVIPYLFSVDENAKKIGAVNTIVKKDGNLYGYNTDFLGLKALINKAGIEILNKKVLILGSGGTSKTAYFVAQSMGAKEILVVSRKGKENKISYEEALKKHNDAQVIINTTPVGMYPNIGVSPIKLECFKNLSGVIDAVYNPLKSELIIRAQELGINCLGGLYMLIAQAVFAAEKFLDTDISLEEIDKIYNSIILNKRNLVLIGMPSCGKSTLGKKLAESLSKDFVDSDLEIEKLTGMTCSEIISKYGEPHFRELESMVIAELSKRQSLVIATGGGAVLNSRNVDLLKENGFLVFVDRDVDKLIATDDRPLSKNREALKKLYKERKSIYISAADLRVLANGSIEENFNAIKEGFINENTCN